VKNATKVVQALLALHKALGDSWSTEIRTGYVSLQATNEREHRKLAGYFGLTPTWEVNPTGKTETLQSKGVVEGIEVSVFAPTRSVRQPSAIRGDLKKTPALADALALADEAVRP
jgi:hypothetical protein